ncbi:hypothetical protein RsoM2USA_139 [Ralstonia phage RsoM2USA]|nr:hypothetical protein RsoM2USA_139 [Ralstonia phage RsoM2USA]
MKPRIHAKISVKKFGGKAEDYIAIHDFIDSSKSCVPDIRHRTILHSAFGCYLVEKVFGHFITNSDGKEVSTRDVAEEHIMEDLGFLPTMQDYLQHMTIEPWMSGTRKRRTIDLD